MRQHGWIGFLYLAGLLFTLPLQLMIGSPNGTVVHVRNLFEYHGDVQMIFILSLPVIASVFITRYIQSRPAADLYHSLPLRREHLLTAHLTSGLLLLIVPVWLTAAITALLSGRQDLDYLFTLSDVLSWAVTVTVITLFLYSFSLLVGMCTGQSIFQTVAVYAILFLPLLLAMLLTAHFNRYLYGYPERVVANPGIDFVSPLYRMIGIAQWPFGILELLIYAALAILFLGLSYFLYKKRSMESAGQAVAHTFFRPLFKVGMILCLMPVSGIYFDVQSNGKTGWLIAGYVLGVVAGYFVSEIILRKSWQIWSKKVAFELVVYGAGIGLLLYGSVSGITGYETRIPAAYSVSEVYMGDYFDRSNTEEENAFSRNPDYIAAVLSLQREIVRERPPEYSVDSSPVNYRSVAMFYRLKDGGTMYREYRIPEEQFRDELKTVMEFSDYKKSQYWLDKLNGTTAYAEISSSIAPNHRITVQNPADMRTLEQALLQDMEQLSYEEMTTSLIPETDISIYWDVPGSYREHRTQSYPVRRSFTHVQTWLNQTGYATSVQVDPEKMNMELVRLEGNSLANAASAWIGLEEEFARLKESNGAFTLESTEVKKQVLEHNSDFDSSTVDVAYLIRTKVGVDERYSVIYRKDMTPELEKALHGNTRPLE
ncbi:multidrug ABC transporter permease [Paenibacillus sp. P96]|uniref:Multidrug ABC transporter permease n=1 Tax=Paenibacillus zeirhizosphaerae TaxID=2987519 RepID=A0ABT9FX38_9BACL|nr:multidrug ABC transporter permease [Paenibacillus sp. P96]MDP4099071.1 multidrug ABC transporter permease [Paenibacillus sp. P96]